MIDLVEISIPFFKLTISDTNYYTDENFDH